MASSGVGKQGQRQIPSAGRRWWVASTTGRPDCQAAQTVQLTVRAGRWRREDGVRAGAQIGC